MELDLDDVWDNEIMTHFDKHWDYKHHEPKQKSIIDNHPELIVKDPLQQLGNEAKSLANDIL